jgi:C4-dicarboxylate transporter DctM subunit
MILIFVFLLALFAIGTPIAWAMALAATGYAVLATPVPIETIIQRMFGGIDTFPLLAIPFFILAGNLMNTGGITERLVRFSKVLVGHLVGGLAHVVVVTNMIMAGMSGSGVADAAGSGAVLIPTMKKAGYGTAFSSAIIAASGTIGPIIPPSIPLVIFGSLASASIGRLLLGGAVPGVLMGIVLMVFAYVIARTRRYPSETRSSWAELGRATLYALPPMGMPAIILGGIIGGIMTPTEAAAAGAAYALILGLFVYKELALAQLPSLIAESALATAAIGIIIAAAQPFGWILTFMQAPLHVLSFFQAAQFSQWQMLLIINVVVLILGMFMEGMAIMVMAVPILLPLLQSAQVDLVHFGVVLVLNIMIGTITPPVGTIMYVVCALGETTIAEFSREAWPFIVALVIVLFVITYLPGLVLWLPNLVMPVK